MLKHSPPSWTDFQPVPFAFTCSLLTLTLWQAPSVFITWRLADWSLVMQTFIRGRFANEAELIVLDELNLYREDFFFFSLAGLQMTKEATDRVQIFSTLTSFFCLPRNRTLILHFSPVWCQWQAKWMKIRGGTVRKIQSLVQFMVLCSRPQKYWLRLCSPISHHAQLRKITFCSHTQTEIIKESICNSLALQEGETLLVSTCSAEYEVTVSGAAVSLVDLLSLFMQLRRRFSRFKTLCCSSS